MKSITTMTMHKGRGDNIKDSPSTIKELEAQIEAMRGELYFNVDVEIEDGVYAQRTWQDQCAILEAENTQLKEKLNKIAAHLSGFSKSS
jgi:hypothetical protein